MFHYLELLVIGGAALVVFDLTSTGATLAARAAGDCVMGGESKEFLEIKNFHILTLKMAILVNKTEPALLEPVCCKKWQKKVSSTETK